jgi:hypothetical protein
MADPAVSAMVDRANGQGAETPATGSTGLKLHLIRH